jgi:hypothetical protein
MNLQKVKRRKTCFLLVSYRSRTKIAGSGAGSGSIGQRRGSGSGPVLKCNGSTTLKDMKAINLFHAVVNDARI